MTPRATLRGVAWAAGLLVTLLAATAGSTGATGVLGPRATTDDVALRGAPLAGRLVDPFIGSDGRPPWFSGNTTPAATLPFGMVQLGPDTAPDAGGGPSASASGYRASERLVRGFSPTHLSGAGCYAFGDVPVLPWTAALPQDPGGATVGFDHAAERAGPGWYRSRLDNGVGVSLAAGLRAGLAVFEFPDGVPARLLVKASGSLAGARAPRIRFPSRREVAVSVTSGGFCGSPGRYRVHVVLRFDRAMTSHGTWGAPGPGGWVGFGRAGGPVRAQVGVSFVDVAGARANLDDAALGWSFRRARETASAAWQRELGRVEVGGATADQQLLFDTALYHALLHPTLLSDADGRYPGFDGQVHRLRGRARHYTAIPGWDAYRTHMPLLAWLRPDVASDVVRSLHRAAQEGGWFPRWPLVASYTGIMNGDSAAPVIAAAYAFGARAFPLSAVTTALVRQAEVTDGRPGQGWFQPRPGLADYLRLGYVPSTGAEGQSQRDSGSTTLEYAADDFALSQLADHAGRPRAARRLLARSGAWSLLLDQERDLLLPRDRNGDFPGPSYDPAACCYDFQEGNAVQYTWAVPHDLAGLLGSLGTREQVLSRLDEFHRHLNVGAGLPFAWLGNQPSLATPWTYLWLAAPTRAQDVVSRARTELYTSTPDGLPGNDDLGSLSAWYVWASLGLYPLTPGTPHVGITTPAFPEVTVRSSDGSVTRIVRRGAGRHVRAVTADGSAWSRTWVSLAPGSRPRRLVVGTTDDEEPLWGTAPEDAPPSYPAQ